MKRLSAVILALLLTWTCLADALADMEVITVPMDYTAREQQSGNVDDAIWLYYGLLSINMAQRGMPVDRFLADLEEKHVYCRQITKQEDGYLLDFLENFSLRITTDGEDGISGILMIILCPQHGNAFEIRVDLSTTMPELMSGNLREIPTHTYTVMELGDSGHDLHDCLTTPHRFSSRAATAVFQILQLSVAAINQEDFQVIGEIEGNWKSIYPLWYLDDFSADRVDEYRVNYSWKLANSQVDIAGSDYSGTLEMFCRPHAPSSSNIALGYYPPLLPDLYAFLQTDMVEKNRFNKDVILSFSFTDQTDVFFDGTPSVLVRTCE